MQFWKLLLQGINDGAPFRDGITAQEGEGKKQGHRAPAPQNWGLKAALSPTECTSA